jgi:hypothetical protein
MSNVNKIKQDHRRFKQIVRGKIKQNLRRYMSKGELTAKKGNDIVKVPIPRVDIPRFRYGKKQTGGVGQGEGEVGDSLGDGEQAPGQGAQAGDQAGDHALEVDVTLEELAEIMAEELELPNIEPKGTERLETIRSKYTGIRSTGPESLKHFKRTFKTALRRMVSTGEYDPDDPVIVPIRDDKRFRSWKETSMPQSNAVIVYMMDVSGSMHGSAVNTRAWIVGLSSMTPARAK